MSQQKHNNHTSDKQLLATVEKMVKVQEKNLELRAKELDIERDNIRSNEKIALASIDAQKADRNQQMATVKTLHTQKHIIVGGIVVGVVIVIVVAMRTGNTAFATEFLKIGGAVLAGYIAGLGRGKLEAVNDKKQDQG